LIESENEEEDPDIIVWSRRTFRQCFQRQLFKKECVPKSFQTVDQRLQCIDT
jgi:hypothetical protein